MANLMDLVRELKSLNARKKAGEALSDEENTRRRELKKYLKTALANQSQTGGPMVSGTGAALHSGTGAAVPSATGAPVRAPTPAAIRTPTPTPVQSPTPPAMRAPTPTAMPAVVVPPPRPPAPAPAPARPAVQAKNAFEIDAGNLFAEASASSAVAASVPSAGGPSPSPVLTDPRMTMSELSDVVSVDGLQNMNPLDAPEKATRADLEVAVARASKAAKANRPTLDAKKPQEIETEWTAVHERNGYTPPEVHLNHEEYFESYLSEGLSFVDVAAASRELAPVDPREIELHRAGIATTDPNKKTSDIPRGMVFLDDFVDLYTRGGLSGPADEVEPDIDDPNLLIPGKRKVTVHLLVGGVKRGVVSSYARGALGFTLEPVGSGTVEEISLGQIKAMFVHKAKGKTPVASGQEITVTFKDGKSVKGASDDYAPSAPVFSLVPPSGRGQFELIVINPSAAASVS